MRTLARFEFALGRRVSWGFRSSGHQIKVAPHAFSDVNAFYSRRDEALLFGHFPSRDGSRTVFTCLSHDIVVHETTHALLDGLRTRYMEPSSPDQAAFHEGFADVVALLSVFSLPEVVQALMDLKFGDGGEGGTARPLSARDITFDELQKSVLTGLGKEFGREMDAIGRSALRHSVGLAPDAKLLQTPAYQEPHRRGEVLVAAIMRAFIKVWAERLEALVFDTSAKVVDRVRAAEEGARAADYLLTMVIRALDYCPPVHLVFGAYLSAMLTADYEIRPTDTYRFRHHLLDSFKKFGILPTTRGGAQGRWAPPKLRFNYERSRFESMQRDPDEVFRFVWENRRALGLADEGYTRILSVRPCIRVAPEDGFPLRETVVEVLQQVTLPAGELGSYEIEAPVGMQVDQPVMLIGGATVIFGEYGQVKYVIGDRVLDAPREEVQKKQSERLKSLWERGHFQRDTRDVHRFASIHRLRGLDAMTVAQEEW
ncbi:hypothetical protein [Pyxidicoccus caerfyrddinensis]|uniref:hypothetical protein n=1 Tax=Pyxidicoccus caerfyrddinensis TaxID=2709663 RepID=UPI0013D9DBA1|nr:hypothetical protein [Pyxidicoccus caerfyrddinensis]